MSEKLSLIYEAQKKENLRTIAFMRDVDADMAKLRACLQNKLNIFGIFTFMLFTFVMGVVMVGHVKQKLRDEILLEGGRVEDFYLIDDVKFFIPFLVLSILQLVAYLLKCVS